MKSDNDSYKMTVDALQLKNSKLEISLSDATKSRPQVSSSAETYWREKTQMLENEMKILRLDHAKTSQELLDIKTINDENAPKLQSALDQVSEQQKKIEKLEIFQVHNFLLAVEVERIRTLYLELENEYFSLQSDMEKMDSQLKSKTLPVINEAEEDNKDDGLLIKSFLLGLENTRLRYLYNEVLKEKQQITELMEEMHSIVNEQSKDHSVSSPLNRSFDKKHQSNINDMQRKDGAPSTMMPDNARQDVNQLLERYQK